MNDTLPPEFWRGVEEFNQQEFYACHDTLEALWMEAIEPEKRFYQGILQIAVALYHLSHQNHRGAVILLGEGMNRLQRYYPSFAEIDVAALVDDSLALLTELQHIQPEAVAEIANQMQRGDRTLTTANLVVPTIKKTVETY